MRSVSESRARNALAFAKIRYAFADSDHRARSAVTQRNVRRELCAHCSDRIRDAFLSGAFNHFLHERRLIHSAANQALLASFHRGSFGARANQRRCRADQHKAGSSHRNRHISDCDGAGF